MKIMTFIDSMHFYLLNILVTFYESSIAFRISDNQSLLLSFDRFWIVSLTVNPLALLYYFMWVLHCALSIKWINENFYSRRRRVVNSNRSCCLSYFRRDVAFTGCGGAHHSTFRKFSVFSSQNRIFYLKKRSSNRKSKALDTLKDPLGQTKQKTV